MWSPWWHVEYLIKSLSCVSEKGKCTFLQMVVKGFKLCGMWVYDWVNSPNVKRDDFKTFGSTLSMTEFHVPADLILKVPYFPAHKTHRDFLVRKFRKKIMMNIF